MVSYITVLCNSFGDQNNVLTSYSAWQRDERKTKKGKDKSCLPNKVFRTGEETMSLRVKSVNVSTLCQLGPRRGEADMEEKVLASHLTESLWGIERC